MCVVARTPAILIINNVFWQYCSNITKTGFVDSFGSIAAILPERVITEILPETNLNVKSVLQQYCETMLQRYCCNRCQKPCILVRENLFALLYYSKFGWGIKKKKLSAVYCKLTFVAKNLIGLLSCDCKNACVFHSRQQIWRMY